MALIIPELEKQGGVRSAARDWIWPVAIALSMLSGATALGHQLLWTRRLIDLLGASAESTSRVFGCFFLGLAIGAAVAFWIAPRVRRPWQWLAAAEIGIFFLAIPVLFLPSWSAWIWPVLGPERLSGMTGASVKFFVSILLVTPPALLMGWFLPMLALALLGRKRSLRKEGLLVYGWNTLGGVCGVAVTAIVFLPLFGAFGAMAAVMGLNLVTAVAFFALDCLTADDQDIEKNQSPPVPVRRGDLEWHPTLALVLSFLSGALILALEVAALQMIMLVAPLSFQAPAIILFSVILVLALAAWLAVALLKYRPLLTLLPWALALAALATAATPLLFFWLAHAGGVSQPSTTLAGFFFSMSVFTLVSCGPAFLAAGVLFPFLTFWSGGEGRDSGGKRWGLLLAANGVGGLFGAELAFRLLLPAAGVYGAAWWIGATYAGAALAVLWILEPHREGNSRRGWLFSFAAAGLILLLHAPVISLSTVNPYAGLTVLTERSERDGSLAVVERQDFGRGILMYNQYMLGTTSARYDQERQAHIPLLLHPQPREVAFIGLATGITPGAALSHSAVERITAVELSRMIVETARDYFFEYNSSVVTDPRTRVIVEDGRTFIAAARRDFDLVIGDLFLPWGPGEARLYSREHFSEVRASLREGGLFCQWLALYQLTAEDLAIIVNTFHEVFPRSYWFVNTFRPDAPALALIGMPDGELDWETIRSRTTAERQAGGLKDPSVRHPEGLALLYLGSEDRGAFSDYPVHTLDNMLIELQAGRRRVSGEPAEYLAGEIWTKRANERREQLRGQPGQPDYLDRSLRGAILLSEREIRRRGTSTWGPTSERELRETMPEPLANDLDADWGRWPGVRPPLGR